jgi:hypothetical protein
LSGVALRRLDVCHLAARFFQQLIHPKKPREEDDATAAGVAYTASGSGENVFASLVVLLAYAYTLSRTAQWEDNVRNEVGDGLAFPQEAEREGELLRALFQPRGQPDEADAILRAAREFPGRADTDGDTLRASALQQHGPRRSAASGARSSNAP